MKTDVQIAQEAKMKPIKEVADYLGFPEEAIELYGNYKCIILECDHKSKLWRLTI